jgi:hypothetical protein
MRPGVIALVATAVLSNVASAQWATECHHYTSRLFICRTTHAPSVVDSRTRREQRSRKAPVAPDTALLDSRDVLGVWRASGVRFESHGRSTVMAMEVTAIPDGVHVETAMELGMPDGREGDLRQIAPRTFRATDALGRVTTLRVLGGHRADLTITGSGGSGTVTYQFDEHDDR